jgi:DNA repair protein RadA/Sms
MSCNSWDTIEESSVEFALNKYSNKNAVPTNNIIAQNLNDQINESSRSPSGIKEFDRVLGGGLVEGGVTLIGGSPGIGKSTLLLQLVANFSGKSAYVSGEESSKQIQLRANRLSIKNPNISLISSNIVTDIIAFLSKNKDIKMVIIDSIQTMYIPELASTPGSVTQVRSCTLELTEFAKKNGLLLFLVGHVTKDGQIAGPKIIEHMVDTVLYFEGEKDGNYKILRTIKNRFGATNELAIFEMLHDGLKEIDNPSKLFLSESENPVSGTAIFAAHEGSRTLLLEVQALVAESQMAAPRRAVVGWDANRLAVIVAVINSRTKFNLSNKEIYFNVAGGFKINEPAVDLAAAASLISALLNKPLPAKTIILGEIALSGEIRQVSYIEERLKEAQKLGFEHVIMAPPKKKINISNMQITAIKHINQLPPLFLSS